MLTLASWDVGLEVSVSAEPDTAPAAGRVAAAARCSLIAAAAPRANTFSRKPFAQQIRENKCQGRQGGGGEIGSSGDERDEAG